MAPNRRRNDNHQQHNGHHHNGHGVGGSSRPMTCCVPKDCVDPGKLIYREDIGTSDIEVIKVICNNDHCDQGEYMHRECFEIWEQTVLTYLKSCGRARSWSEKQRLQNLWTKRGYDLAFKACSCKCGKGHLRKDLDWVPPPRTVPIAIPGARDVNPDNNNGQEVANVVAVPAAPASDAAKKKKKTKTKEPKPTLAVSAPVPHPNNNHATTQQHQQPRGSVDSGNGSVSSSSVPKSSGSHAPAFGSLGSSSSGSFDLVSSLPSCTIITRPRMNSVSSNGSSGSSGSSGGSPPSPEAQFSAQMSMIHTAQNIFKFQRKNSRGIEIPDRIRRDSGNGGLFTRRVDFSSFNKLPRHKLNSYHIKMEDETHGNDDTRNFILTTLMTAKVSRVSCILCSGNLVIFDRYPLIDGTFFLSPRQHSLNSVEILNGEGRAQYLSAVCMGCLEGWRSILLCRCCGHRWDGSDLVLGTCYTYDIFAATPCCQERLCCSNCKGLLMRPDQRPTFFSEYSQSSQCPNCRLVDYHLAKRLSEIFDKASN